MRVARKFCAHVGARFASATFTRNMMKKPIVRVIERCKRTPSDKAHCQVAPGVDGEPES